MPPSKTLRLAASEAMQLSLELDHSKLPKNTIVMLIQVPGSEGNHGRQKGSRTLQGCADVQSLRQHCLDQLTVTAVHKEEEEK